MIASYPRNAFGYLKLSLVYGHLGQYEKAVGLAYRAQSLAPDRVGAYEQLANALLASQHLEETRQTVQQAQARKLDGHVLHAALYALGFMGSDATSMAEQQQWFAASAALENFGLSLAADTEAYSGHMAKAQETSQRSVDAAIRADNKEEGAIWWENAALREAAFGNPLAGRHAAANGLKLDASSLGVQVEAALALAMSGESAQAGLMAENLNERYALDTQVQALWLPAIRAQLALNRGDSAEAVSQLQRSLPTLEFGQISFIGNISCLYGTYVRGNAYLAAGQGTAAAVEFQKILDHSGIVWNCWTGALAKLGVARAYALTAGSDADSREKARAAYSGFLTLWQNADAQIPILQQAKAEYARLQ
jgi:tetratricopeptide (TPR) repeat protein